MRILSWNINGIRAMLKKDYIKNNESKENNTFNNFIKKYDIICLQELKIYDKINFETHKFNYLNLCTCKKGYSGVGILTNIEPISVKKSKRDGRSIILEFDKFYLINAYFPNAGPHLERIKDKEIFNKFILDEMKKLSKYKEVLIVGDFNAVLNENDVYNFKQMHNKTAGVTDLEINYLNQFANEYYNIFRNFHPKKIQYSYFSYRFPARLYNKGMLLDHAFSTKKLYEKCKDINYLNVYGSDHLPLLLKF